jgi:serine/threonine protein kinase
VLVRASVVTRRRKRNSFKTNKTADDRQSRLRVFAIVYIFVNLPLAASYVIAATTNLSIPFELFCCTFTLSYLQGLLDALVLGTDRHSVRNFILTSLSAQNLFFFVRSNEVESSSEEGHYHLVGTDFERKKFVHENTSSAPYYCMDEVFIEPDASDFAIPFSSLTLERPLGSGASGIVWAGTMNSQPVAIKQLLHMRGSSSHAHYEHAVADFRHESSILAKFRHPNIVSLLGISIAADGPKQDIYLVMELCKQSLADYMLSENWQTITILQVVRIAIQAASALQFLHSKSVAHCDIKPENLLLTDTMTVKLADFGVSKSISSDMKATKSLHGTPAYISPEVWRGEDMDDKTGFFRTDIYAFGILLNYMLTKSNPNDELGKTSYNIMVAITNKKRPKLPADGSGCPSLLMFLVTSCWTDDPKSRPVDFMAIIAMLEASEALLNISE